jgi:K+/H+ antiporter YhaU regulatory subunit KhtT
MGERVVGQKLADTGLDSKWRLKVIAVQPIGREDVELLPPPDYVFREGDVVLLAGSDTRLAFTR